MIRIVIISKGEQDRAAIRACLYSQDDFYIANMGNSAYDALRFAADLHPDIIIMDLWLDDIDSTVLAPIIKRNSPETGIIAIGSADEIMWVNEILRAGISGFLVKQTDMDTLISAIRTVLYGGYYLSAPVKAYMAAGFSGDVPKTKLYPHGCFVLNNISSVERKMINYLALGFSDKEIADKLQIATGTIRNMLISLKRKTGLKNRIQVICHALLCGLITEPLWGGVRSEPPPAEIYPTQVLSARKNNGSGRPTLQ